MYIHPDIIHIGIYMYHIEDESASNLNLEKINLRLSTISEHMWTFLFNHSTKKEWFHALLRRNLECFISIFLYVRTK